MGENQFIECPSSPVLVLSVQDIWIREPFRALGAKIPTIGLLPEYHRWKWLFNRRAQWERGWCQQKCFLMSHTFGRLANFIKPVTSWTFRQICPAPRAVVLTHPSQRSALRLFKRSPHIYYAADNYAYYGLSPKQLLRWERDIAESVDHIVVVSHALSEMFIDKYGVDPTRIHISPNAVSASVIPGRCPEGTAPTPTPIPPSFRPLAGIIGVISNRLRLGWLRKAVESLPWLYWAFIGPIREKEMDSSDRKDLESLLANPRCCFTGWQPYENLPVFFAAFDVGIIPLSEFGVNPTASAVRLFQQLPFGQPILATPGCHQLEEFKPYVAICYEPQMLIESLNALREKNFDDGLRKARWEISKQHTWEQRVTGLLKILNK